MTEISFLYNGTTEISVRYILWPSLMCDKCWNSVRPVVFDSVRDVEGFSPSHWHVATIKSAQLFPSSFHPFSVVSKPSLIDYFVRNQFVFHFFMFCLGLSFVMAKWWSLQQKLRDNVSFCCRNLVHRGIKYYLCKIVCSSEYIHLCMYLHQNNFYFNLPSN